MAAFDQGITNVYSSLPAIQTDIFGVGINWYVNRTPIVSRFPKFPAGSPSFVLINDAYRPRTGVMNQGASLGIGATSLTVVDGSAIDVGDVINIASEYILVTAVNGNVLTISKGFAGTTDAAQADGQTFNLVSNIRTGADVDINAVTRIPVPMTQWNQTVQHAYQVGGALEAMTAYISAYNTPLDRDRMMCMQHCFDDFESAIYYGKVVGVTGNGTTTNKPMMAGFQSIIATNNTASPTNAATYKPSDLIRDTVQKCFNNGGQPNVLIVSPDFLVGLSIWGVNSMRIDAGVTAFGTPIDLFEVSFLQGLTIIPAPLLRTGTAICLTSPECKIRMVRELFDKPRGSRGDAYEGDMIMTGALELDNEQHHAWVEGITGYAA